MYKSHEVVITIRMTKAASTDPYNTTTPNVDEFMVDGRDEIESLMTAPHLAALQAAVLNCVQDVYSGNVL